MDGHTLVIEWIGIILALVFGVTMFCQGHAIFHANMDTNIRNVRRKNVRCRKQLEDIIKTNNVRKYTLKFLTV